MRLSVCIVSAAVGTLVAEWAWYKDHGYWPEVTVGSMLHHLGATGGYRPVGPIADISAAQIAVSVVLLVIAAKLLQPQARALVQRLTRRRAWVGE